MHSVGLIFLVEALAGWSLAVSWYFTWYKAAVLEHKFGTGIGRWSLACMVPLQIGDIRALISSFLEQKFKR